MRIATNIVALVSYHKFDALRTRFQGYCLDFLIINNWYLIDIGTDACLYKSISRKKDNR